jgi:hypothetical protein
MRIEITQDLSIAWYESTMLCKIFYFWLFCIGFLALLFVSIFITCVTKFGDWAGFFKHDESKENEETD